MQRFLVEREHFQLLVREIEDRAARRLINAVILHADEPVFDNIQNADAVLAAELVQLADDVGDLHLLAVDGHRNACLKADGNGRGRIGRLIGGHAHFEKQRLVEIGLVCRILEIETLVAQVPQVLVLGVVRLAGDLQRHMVRLGVVDLLVTGLDLPLSPRRDDRHIRREALDGQLKPDLIVALAGRAVRDGVGALGQRDFGQLLADNGPRKRGAEQILFVFCVHHDGRDDNLVAHLVGEIGDNQLARAGLDGLFLETVQLVALTDISRDGDDLGIVIMLLQPGDNDRSIQTARIGQNDFFDLALIHVKTLHKAPLCGCFSLCT